MGSGGGYFLGYFLFLKVLLVDVVPVVDVGGGGCWCCCGSGGGVVVVVGEV